MMNKIEYSSFTKIIRTNNS